MLTGQIVKQISNSYSVLCQKKIYTCTSRGLFRYQKKKPLLGDRCTFDEKNNYILDILPRQNELQRPEVANVDYALIVVSMVQPLFSSLLLDKQITSILLSKVTPILFFSKIDLLNPKEKENYQKIRSYYEKIGFLTYDYENLGSLLTKLKKSLVVLTGQSGAGKSTLIHHIDPKLEIKTDEISQSLNRGKHTTRHSEVYFAQDIAFLDTPGFSSLSFYNTEKEKIKKCFPEFANCTCRFKDCNHLKETDCQVKQAVTNKEILLSRYESYQKIWEECKK